MMKAVADDLRMVAVSQLAPDERSELIDRYRRDVFEPAFPDEGLREDPAVWLNLFATEPDPPSPLIEVFLLLDGDTIAGGATVEFYRTAEAGLLTYLCVAEGYRRSGVGQKLVGLCGAWLKRIGGADCLLFAETERLAGAHDAAQATQTRLRQKVLRRLGARKVLFDYVMPPLRAGEESWPLHLLVINAEVDHIPATIVRSLIADLAASLGADLQAHAGTRSMMQALDGADTLRVLGLVECDEHLAECPVFPGFERASVAFAFRLRIRNQDGDESRTSLRIAAIHNAVMRRDKNLDRATRLRAEKLMRPFRSFLDDITNGPPGTNGRPLIAAATDPELEREQRAIRLVRPESWPYEFEGQTIALQIAGQRRELDVAFNESFALFESGEIFYILAIGNQPDGHTRLDEYGLIQLQQIAVNPELAGDRDYLGLSQHAGSYSLLDFANRRLASLEGSDHEPSGAPSPNAIRDILRPFGVLKEGARLEPLRSSDIANALVEVEDEALFDVAYHCVRHYRSDAEADPVPAADDWSTTTEQLDAAWQKQWRGAGIPSNLHVQCPDDENIPRPVLAFAGIAQAVPDFQRQDLSEIHDSTRPVYSGPENLFFVHPAMQLEVGKNWRTFSQSHASIGGCPYALLTWIVAIHDELLVSGMERDIEEIFFGRTDAGTPCSELARARPLGSLDQVLKAMHKPIPTGERLLEYNLQARIDLFRRYSIHQSGNIFRYPTERELLGNIREARGTRQRFENAHALIDRYENLVEDVSGLAAGILAERTNMLLTAIAVLGLLQLPGVLRDWIDPAMGIEVGLAVTIALLLALYLAIRLGTRQLSRSRKSG